MLERKEKFFIFAKLSTKDFRNYCITKKIGDALSIKLYSLIITKRKYDRNIK